MTQKNPPPRGIREPYMNKTVIYLRPSSLTALLAAGGQRSEQDPERHVRIEHDADPEMWVDVIVAERSASRGSVVSVELVATSSPKVRVIFEAWLG